MRGRADTRSTLLSEASGKNTRINRVDVFQNLLRLAFLNEMHRSPPIKAGQGLRAEPRIGSVPTPSGVQPCSAPRPVHARDAVSCPNRYETAVAGRSCQDPPSRRSPQPRCATTQRSFAVRTVRDGHWHLTDRPIGTLSGGQQQRAWLAMVIAQEAPVILLDGPTNHLDICHALETLALVRRLSREQGRTVVVALHDLNFAARFCRQHRLPARRRGCRKRSCRSGLHRSHRVRNLRH